MNECILHMLYVCIITILKYHVPGINPFLDLLHNSLYIYILGCYILWYQNSLSLRGPEGSGFVRFSLFANFV